MSKVYIITGASSGFGYDTTLKLLNKGYIVYSGARRVELMSELKNYGAHTIYLDITDQASIESFVKQVIDEQGVIDGVLVNAGYGVFGTIEDVTMDVIRHQFDVNYFGSIEMIKQVLPYMRNNKSGSIVVTSSLVSRISTPAMGYYSASKHALRASMDSLRQEVKDLGIKVVMIEPGVVRTGFDAIAFDKLDKIEPLEEYADIVNKFNIYLKNEYQKPPSLNNTTDAMVKALTIKNPKNIYRTTLDSKLITFLRRFINEGVFDKVFKMLLDRKA